MYVVDASVWVSRFWTRDPHHTEARSWVFRIMSSGGQIFGPSILLPEVAGPLCRRTGEVEMGLYAVRQLVSLPGLYLLDVDDQMARLSGELAAQLRLKGADAIYVAAAMLRDVPLITLDTEQRERASRVVTASTPV